MIYAFDTYYYEEYAYTVCIAFEHWESESESEIYSEKIPVVSDYESGAFYKRELPCILSLLSQIPVQKGDVIIVDGYVTLGNNGKIGLGGYLYEAMHQEYPIVGIAKNRFSEDNNQ
ncbi:MULTISPECIES: endonuclease V [Chryseobacterium]|uniref:Deoxyinosine 3'endonuclease (Endonuclease V) n=1 Tax=Chryseobacterium camelliae TaxID=1265445 RepID=A0ABU0TG70_9FLAO|nr:MULTISPECIES: endonuclease V [Chryseobacterium]MDT3406145.1 deoxyinosine 3'endonuclease (endonuclease V) [Pseudacidovorax intermedius]MDQ1096052.1 deoxyinosine 3'endonuclease (endonuclease V) [Chryseobacterium camelliae]MDQ1099988.1 deoxyinosine 3'endonuclease (endonuclease V) [Chryseobacterium sp. SORGH_AS_1048]MDR6087334.1 deoxyinosine 3'endonuclease (endonuclease V) [Chryseobacterium sp. SORGH_AS_0909]MDR6131709.1 deoxyinosine 3'endonuclease (endonuclease V) [Chryseobacterium sp. SORGH_A